MANFVLELMAIGIHLIQERCLLLIHACSRTCTDKWRHGHAGQGSHEPRSSILIYICFDLLSINKYHTILNYKYLLWCYKLVEIGIFLWCSITVTFATSRTFMGTDLDHLHFYSCVWLCMWGTEIMALEKKWHQKIFHLDKMALCKLGINATRKEMLLLIDI